MVAYQLLLNNTYLHEPSINLEWRLIENVHSVPNLIIDDDFMLSTYNFKLSQAEIRCFQFHYSAWADFLSTPHAWCLIIEDQTKIKSTPLEIVSVTEELPDDCDIFFPFDKSGAIGFNKDFHEPYVLGFQWGSFAYFINKNGAKKLVEITTIRQPVDEEILTLSLKGIVNSISAHTSLFEGAEWALIKQERHNRILQAILSSNAWSNEEREKAQGILSELVSICDELNIKVILDSGTLLGHIRHGEIMPWDDDIDLAVHEVEMDRIIDSVKGVIGLRCGKFKWSGNGCDYYKFWHEHGNEIDGHEYKFPFVDVWLYSLDSEKIVFRHGIVFEANEFYPLQKVNFENQELWIPFDAIRCLDKIYPTWKTMIHVYPWSHRKEKSCFYPLSTFITVNENGRMLI